MREVCRRRRPARSRGCVARRTVGPRAARAGAGGSVMSASGARAVRPMRVPGSNDALVIRGLAKHFERDGTRTEAIRGLDLTVREREFVCLVGASGCGKSTLLSIIAGLDTPSVGEVDRVGSKPALLFQEAALFPWLDVRENVGL